jgi:GNAT superfamily N-acetyltransferase
VTEANVADLPAITALYRRDRLSFRVDVGVSDLSPALASALTKERLLPYGHNATLFAPVARSSAHTGSVAAAAKATSLSFERVLPDAPEALDAYTEIYLAGFGLGGQRAARWAEARERHENPALCLVLARVDGVPAGIGGLFVSRGVGYLGPAATLPAFRGRGVQSALIADRLARAAAGGCELVAAHASFGTSSHHNLERAGLRLLQTKTLWRPRLAAPKRSPRLVDGPR